MISSVTAQSLAAAAGSVPSARDSATFELTQYSSEMPAAPVASRRVGLAGAHVASASTIISTPRDERPIIRT